MIKINKLSLVVLTLATTLAHSSASLATDYYVSTSGSDSAQGTLSYPFKTISKAAATMVAGDITYIRGGTYREQVNLTKSGVAGSPISFEGYQNEQVTITGTDELSGWVQHAGSVYKTTVNSDVTQLFANGRQMDMARWPNMPDNLLSHNNALVDAADMSPASGNPWVEGTDIPSGDWTGAKAWFISKAAWGSVSTTIASKSGNRIYLDENPSSHSQLEPEVGGAFYLYNSLTALDVDDEYWYDATSNTLYFQATGGNTPDLLALVEARTRYYGLDFRNKSFIEVRNIDFKAANIKITGSNNILEYSKIEYAGPYVDSVTWGGSKGVELSGHNNTLRFSEISNSWGDGVTMVTSSYDNVLENCIIHDVNWSAGWGALINAKGTNTRVQYNTAYNAGRTGIRHYNFEGGSIDYNNVFNYGFLTADLGGIKTGNNHALDTRISYNWVHDQQAVKSANGIYLDTGTENFTVHHNVTWNTGKTGLRANKDALNIKFYHNTLIDAEWAMGHYAPNDEVYVNVDTQNNIATAAPFLGNVLQNNMIDTTNNFAFAGYRYGDFRLTSTSSVIDQATEVTGYSDGYAGLSPDAGAYEFGGSEAKSHWMPGISWAPEWNTAPVASFTVSGGAVAFGKVIFDATTSTDADGTINRYFWDFGDGSLGAGQVVSHQYQDSGLYTVTLTVNDAFGGKNTLSTEVDYSTKLAAASISTIAPLTALKQHQVTSTISNHGPKKGYITASQQTRYQTLGQSFTINPTEIGVTIESLTVKVVAATDFSQETNGHNLLLAFMHDTDGNTSLETQLGQVLEADLSGLNIVEGDYLTISFSEPITLDNSGEYGFILYWQESNTSNILTLERGTGDGYSTGDAIFKNLISAPDTFPVTTTPSGDKDFTFYLD